jgi:cytochrome o ubiquinol oxidase subunit 3
MELERRIEHIESDIKVFGFWIYLMTDLIIFAVLFATFAVLRNNTNGGPSGHDIFDISSTLTETLILLSSSFSCAMGMLSIYRMKKLSAFIWFGITFILGAAFLFLELKEFTEFVDKGDSWQHSAFLSSFFTLVGTHGLHITIGLIWMLAMMFRICLRPLIEHSISKIFRMALFWHFLDFVWIFIFTIVYGMEFLG